jgi:iron(III) transport system permease protein
MFQRRLQYFALIAFFIGAMMYPLAHVILRAFIVNGSPSLHFFGIMLSSDYYRDVLCNSLNVAIAVTILSTLAAYPIALVMSRFVLPAQGLIHALILLPLISPPFVGALGFRQLFGRFGSVNTVLMNSGISSEPIEWLRGGGAFGIILLQTLHLVPILYLSIGASLRSAHVSLEEAARVFGASRWQVLRRVTIPLSLPGWFAGATLVFIASFTDLGTPLIFDYRSVIPVQIFNMLSDLNENPVGYSFVVLTCSLSIALFFLSRGALTAGSYAGSARTRQGRLVQRRSVVARALLTIVVVSYAAVACIPQASVVLIACAKTWFATTLPSEWSIQSFVSVLTHPMTAHSLLTSLWLSLAASLITMIIGFQVAYVIARTHGRWSHAFEILSIIPLAVPGIVFAFGYIGAFSGTILDNRINPFPLLLAAYSIRRLPAMVRSGTAGLQEASVALEEAAVVLGASPFTTARRIILPLVSRHILVGAVLTFAYSMIEVSDSLLLAMEVKFYPVSKAIYALMGRPDGVELASALGTVVMAVMFIAFYGAEWFSTRAERKRAIAALALIIAILPPTAAHAETDQIVAVTPHWEGIKDEFERGFAAHYRAETGREVEIRWLDIGGTSDIVKYLKAQHRSNPGKLGIDVVFGGGTDVMIELARSGVLKPVTLAPRVIDRIPPTVAGVPLYSPQRDWYIAAISIFGIIANTVAADTMHLPPPTSWYDLGKPEYFDLVAIADPSKSGSMHAMFEVILQGYGWSEGWKLLTRMAANSRTISNHASQVGKDVATGESIFGIAIDTYAGDVIRQVGSRVKFITPSDYSAITGDGIALIQGAPHAELGKRFIEFVLSEAGQKIWYYKRGTPGGPTRFEIGKLPIIPELYDTGEPATVVPGSPFTFRNVFIFDAQKAAKRWNIVNDLFSAFITQVHDRLTAFARTHPGVQAASVPLSESDAIRLSPDGSWGTDQAVRSATVQAWSAQALAEFPEQHGRFYRYRWAPSLIVCAVLVITTSRRLRRRLRQARR